jgi:hypothetical protein
MNSPPQVQAHILTSKGECSMLGNLYSFVYQVVGLGKRGEEYFFAPTTFFGTPQLLVECALVRGEHV